LNIAFSHGLGGKRFYRVRLGKDRSAGQSRHYIASVKIGFIARSILVRNIVKIGANEIYALPAGSDH
jgi:hypothetical protein